MWDLYTVSGVAGLCMLFKSLLTSSDALAGPGSSLSRAGEEQHPIPSAATSPAPLRIDFESLCKLE